jgi:hypothetical protein
MCSLSVGFQAFDLLIELISPLIRFLPSFDFVHQILCDVYL